jgi:hypothetical protein
LLARYGSLDGVLVAAAGPDQSVVLSKVRRDLDYVKRAVQVATIPTDIELPDLDLTRPRDEPDPAVYAAAENAGLGGAARRLTAALTGAS